MCFTAMTVMWFAVMSEESTAKSKTPGSKCELGAPGGFLAHGFPEHTTGPEKRGEIPRLRKPTPSRERRRGKQPRLAPLGMTVVCFAMMSVDGAGEGIF